MLSSICREINMRKNGISRKKKKTKRRNFISRLKEVFSCCCKGSTEPEEGDLAVSETDRGQSWLSYATSLERSDASPDPLVSSHNSLPSPSHRDTESVANHAPPTAAEDAPPSPSEPAPHTPVEATPPSPSEPAPCTPPDAAPPNPSEPAPHTSAEAAPPSPSEPAPHSPPDAAHTMEPVQAVTKEISEAISAHNNDTEKGNSPTMPTEPDSNDGGDTKGEPDSAPPHMVGSRLSLFTEVDTGNKQESDSAPAIEVGQFSAMSVVQDVAPQSAECLINLDRLEASSSSLITQGNAQDRSASPGEVELSVSRSLLSRPSNPRLILVKPVAQTLSEPSTAAAPTERVLAEECRLTASDSTVEIARAARPRHWPVLAYVRASFHQGSARLPQSSWKGNQCTTMALVAVTLSAIKPVNTWTKADLDGILRDGDRNHGALLARLGRLGQINQRVGIYELVRCSRLSITLGDQSHVMAGVSDTEVMGMVSASGPVDAATLEAFQMVDLQTGLKRALDGSDGAVLTIGDYSTGVIPDPRGGVRIWDSHCRGRDGLFRPDGRAVLLTLGSLDDVTPFVIRKLRSRKQTQAQYEVAGFRLVE